MADLKLGMNSVHRSGIQQNTTCMFDTQFEKVEKPKEDTNSKLHDKFQVACKTHHGHRKPLIDQNNPYVERRLSS